MTNSRYMAFQEATYSGWWQHGLRSALEVKINGMTVAITTRQVFSEMQGPSAGRHNWPLPSGLQLGWGTISLQSWRLT